MNLVLVNGSHCATYLAKMFGQYENVAQRLYTVENSAFYKSCDTPGHIPKLYTFLLAIATRQVGALACGESFDSGHLVSWGKPSAGKSIHTKLNLDIFSCAKALRWR